MTKSRPFFTLLLVVLTAVLLLGVLLEGCSSGDTVSTTSNGASATSATTPVAPARAIFQASGGTSIGTAGPHRVFLNIEVARSSKEKAAGLMFRRELAPDQGMVFIWDTPVKEPFWMKNTLIPLSIAFISQDGTVLDIQEMAAQSLDFHNPAAPYSKAVEANQGFFSNNGIRVGDQVTFEGI